MLIHTWGGTLAACFINPQKSHFIPKSHNLFLVIIMQTQKEKEVNLGRSKRFPCLLAK
jgi:hypothetical protein